MLTLNGAGDQWMCRTECARRFTDRLGAAEVEFREIGASDIGGGTQPDHMTIVVDRRSEPVWHGIVDWIQSRVVDMSPAG